MNTLDRAIELFPETSMDEWLDYITALVHKTASVDSTVTLGRGSIVGPNCIVFLHAKLFGAITLGRGVTVGPFSQLGDKTTVQDGTEICPDCLVGCGVTIGRYCMIHHSCNIDSGAQIRDRSQVGANSEIGIDTVIGKASRLGPNSKVCAV